MLNRRILRIKAFKVLYAYAENQDLSLEEVLDSLETSCEATRDLYLYMMALIPALTAEASRRIEAARGKFNPTEEDLHPNLKFAANGISALLEQDPDLRRLLEKKKLSWEQNDAFLFSLYETLRTRPYYQAYMAEPVQSLSGDAALWKEVFTQEFEDDGQLAAILEDRSIYWADDLGYVLGCCLRSLDSMAEKGRWDFPPLYQSDVLIARGKKGVDSDRQFVRRLVTTAYGHYSYYDKLIAESVAKWDEDRLKWDKDRLFTTDIVLIILGLAEVDTFPEIPAAVSINEYVEISKYYSTPRSHSFVNGLLDRLVKQQLAQGKTSKTL